MVYPAVLEVLGLTRRQRKIRERLMKEASARRRVKPHAHKNRGKWKRGTKPG